MRAYPHLFAKLFGSPLMLHGAARVALERELLARMGVAHNPAPVAMDDEYDHDAHGDPEQATPADTWRMQRVFDRCGSVAIVTVAGVIDKHVSSMDLDCYGGCDLADVDAALGRCADDPSIECVVLAINSPGGSCMGTPETAARVAALCKEKEVVAFVDGVCASAAYYIASQADLVIATPSSVIGSIGVYIAVMDESRAMEMEGYKIELMKSGTFKAMGASFKSITPEERAIFQATSDEIYAEFTAAVNSKRPGVASETMQGQCFRGAKALAAGLADELTGQSLDEYVSDCMRLG